MPVDDAENIKQARRIAQTNLEAVAWNDVLGIEDPPIICKIKIHGQRWGLRFQSAEPAMRGREQINEDLPPIPGDSAGPTADLPHAESPDHGDGASRVLREGGLPG